MPKPIGFTDYFTGLYEAITILSYDNNKYCKIIRHSDNVEYEIKRGYITKNVEGDEFFNRRFWHKLGGGNPRYFKPRVKKTVYTVMVDNEQYSLLKTKFSTGNKQHAIKYAKQVSNHFDEEVEIYIDVSFENKSGYGGGCTDIRLFVLGDYAYQFKRPKCGVLSCKLKYLRHHGKVFSNLKTGKSGKNSKGVK